MIPLLKLTMARVTSGSASSGFGNWDRTGSSPTQSRLSLARAVAINRPPNALVTDISFFTDPSALAPPRIAMLSRYGPIGPSQCTYTRGHCDRAAIEPGASMDVGHYRVKARDGGW